MKYEIEDNILQATKNLILSEIKTARENYNRERNFDKKIIIDSTIKNLVLSFNNLEEHATKPKPIKTIGIVSK